MLCPKCGSTIAATDINVQALVAKCAQCGEVFGFNAQSVVSAPTNALPAPRPEKFTVEEGYYGTNRIVWKWFHPMAYFLLFFFLVWNAFLVFWFSMAFGDFGVPWIFRLFPLIHVAVGVCGTYFTIAMFVNATTITVTDSELMLAHGPMPFPGNKRLERSTLRQLYIEQRLWSGRQHRVSLSYELKALSTDGASVRLVGVLDEGQARFLEQQLEKWLGIKPAPVPGAVN